MNYRIERIEAEGYWNAQRGAWMGIASLATQYTEAERYDILRDTVRGEAATFPAGGCWVKIDDVVVHKDGNPHNNDVSNVYIVPGELRRHNFTVIKLRPVLIRLSATEGDYEDLNAQALEFEAALRLWVKKQQILTGEWSVDFITED